MAGTETVKSTLKAHDKLLFDVIKRQAGTLKKAITEGTMNSIEAGTPEIVITMREGEPDADGKKPAFLRIEDKGVGIKTEEEIVLHFETFGQPHETNEHTIWKQFRMGRGQMFAFGKNVWRTSQFKMVVDINNMGLDYHLTKGLPEVDGCIIDIELYENPIGDWQCRSIEALREEVQEQVRYVRIPVIFNEKMISVDPSTLNWDYEDDNAYYIFNDSSALKIYNLGIYVKSIHQSQAGVGGIVVSKKQLKVNFARNDVQSNCDVFKEIRNVVQDNKLKRASKKYRSMSDGERYSLLRDLRDGAVRFSELKSKRIFRTAQGKWYSWNMIAKSPIPWTFSPEGDMAADRDIELGAALCFSQSMLDELCYSNESDLFFDWIMKEQLRYDKSKKAWEQNIVGLREEVLAALEVKRSTYLRYDDTDVVAQENLSTLRSQFREDYKLIPYSKCTVSEKRILDVLNGYTVWGKRKICLGVSTVAVAWTNGSSYIAVDRNWLRGLNLSANCDILRLFTTLAHEMSHDEDSAGTHVHGPHFKDRYYELTHHRVGFENPIYYVFYFTNSMRSYRIESKRQKEMEKERKLKEKLGLVSAK